MIAAAADAIARYGAGARSSRLVCGNLSVHEELETELAAFKRTEAALVFSSGYLANIGVIQALSQRADGSQVPVFFDRLSHACIVDGALATGRNWRTFAHDEAFQLGQQLARLPSRLSPRALVVTEGVFSMDGDMADLGRLLKVCQMYKSLLVVDDAHGTGTVGRNGRGTAAYFKITDSPRIVHVGTLSKSLGSQGGFVAASRSIIDLLINRARTFIFDTGLAPASAAAALQSLRILQQEPGRVLTLQKNARLLREQLLQPIVHTLPAGQTPIVPVILGEPEHAVDASRELLHKGMFVGAIRPPTVPKGTSRLRITLSSAHTQEQIKALAAHVRKMCEVPSRE